MSVCQIGFVMEQVLGHVTHTKNLQAFVPTDPEVNAHWALVPFDVTGTAARLPLFRSNWTVRAGLRARKQLSALTAKQKLDVLFFHSQVPAVLAQDWMYRIPSIVSLDATPLQYDELGEFYQHSKGPAWLEKIKWQLNRNCFRAARKIVVWAHWTKRGLIEGYGVPEDKITVLPPGVLVREWLRPQPRTLDNTPPKILFVGGDLERKGGSLLLEAFRAIRQPGMELHLVTKSKLAPEPGVLVHGGMSPNSPELKALYHQCDIFVLPTMGDCLPMVLSEAGASGMAAISTTVAGIPEIVLDGQTGFTIPRGDLAALIKALRTLIDQPELRLSMGARAVEHVTHGFDAEETTRQLLALLKAEARCAR